MELPTRLKSLYRHWGKHAAHGAGAQAGEEVFTDAELREQVLAFISERMRAWEKRESGAPPPYSEDPIVATYRFCNILRELDRQTIEYHELLAPLRDDLPLWLLNMFYARMVARPDTVRAIGLLSYDAKENEALLERLLAHPKPRYGTPYVFPVSVIMRSATPTRETFIARYLPGVMSAVAAEVATFDETSVLEGVERTTRVFGMNLKFLWTEVLIDLAYQYPEKIDLFKAFPVGPGALPTFARIDAKADPALLAERLGALLTPSGVTFDGTPIPLSAENWEGVGCEFRKYTNLSKGKGRRRIYAR